MKKFLRNLMPATFMVVLMMLSGCSVSPRQHENRRVMYQASTINALLA